MPSRKKINTKRGGRGLHVDGNDLKQILDGLVKDDKAAFNWFDDWEIDEPVSAPSSVVTPAPPGVPAPGASTTPTTTPTPTDIKNKFKPVVVESINEAITGPTAKNYLQEDFDKCIKFSRSSSYTTRNVPSANIHTPMHDIIEYVEEKIDFNPSAPQRKNITSTSKNIDSIASEFINSIALKTEIDLKLGSASITSSKSPPNAKNILINAYTAKIEELKTILTTFVANALVKRNVLTDTKAGIVAEYKLVNPKLVDELKTFFKSIEDDDALYVALYAEYDTVTLDGSRHRRDGRSRGGNKKAKKNSLNKILASLRPS